MWKTKKGAFYADYIQIEMCDTHDWNYNYAKLKFETEKREKFKATIYGKALNYSKKCKFKIKDFILTKIYGKNWNGPIPF